MRSKFCFFALLFFFISPFLKAQNNIDLNSLPEVADIIAVSGNLEADTVVIGIHGGPSPEFDPGSFAFFEPISTFSVVEVMQFQHYNPNVSNDIDMTFEEGIAYNDTTVAMIKKVVAHYQNLDKTIVLIGFSFGAFLITEYVDDYGMEGLHRVIPLAGRLNMPDIVWQSIRDGYGAGFMEDGVTPIVSPVQVSPEERVEFQLLAGIGYNRWIDSLANEDLTRLMYIYGAFDDAVGRLDAAEIAFLEKASARVVRVEGGHLTEEWFPFFPKIVEFIREKLTPPTKPFDAALANALQTEIAEIIANSELKGISAAVMLSDGSLWKGTAGVSHEGQPVTPDMLFGIGSITKTYTATTTLSMYEDGLLDLEDPISDYLPDFENIEPDVTIRQLLNHTSGIYDYTLHPDYEEALFEDLARIWKPAETLSQFLQSPVFSPGERHEYSNSNYLLLGMIVENIGGNLLSEEYEQRIFAPAHLDSTFLDIEQSHYGLYAHPWYDLDGNGTLEDLDELEVPREAAWSSSWADGAIVATAADVVRFSHALLREQSILSAATLEEMTDFSATSGEYGLGIYPTSTNCSPWIGHNGELIYSSEWAYIESEGISIAILYNQVVDGFTTLQNANALCATIKNSLTSVEDASMDYRVKMYPNPTQDVVYFSLPSNNQTIDIEIFSINGRRVKAYRGNELSVSLDVSDLNSGLYSVRIGNSGVSKFKKLVIH